MLLTANQEQNESYTFKDMLLQPYKSDFVLASIKEVEAHESRSNWILIKNSVINNNPKSGNLLLLKDQMDK